MRATFMLGILAAACEPAVPELPEGVAPGAMSVQPQVVGQGVTVPVSVSIENPLFEANEPLIDLGDGLTVTQVQVVDGRTAVATVEVDDDAALGPRDVSLDIGGWNRVLNDGIQVVAESLAVSPDRGEAGRIITVELTGRNTAWDASSWARFGPGTTVIDMDEVLPGSAVATVAIDPTAEPGLRDVSVDEVTLYGGFTVEAPRVSAVFDPARVPQGATVEYTISGTNTAWTDDTVIEFWDGGLRNRDLQIVDRRTPGATGLFGRLRSSNAAAVGMRDVVIRTGDSVLYVPDAIEVVETVPPLDKVVLQLKWDVTRAVDDRGVLEEKVNAYAVFLVPLDPPCGAPTPPNYGALPHDNVYLQVWREAVDSSDCPTPKSIDAGETVWLANDGVLYPLTRQFPSDGRYLLYEGIGLEPEDYPFGQSLDLITDGSGRIPALTLPGILQTIQGDVRLDGDGTLLHSRYEDLPVTWTPTGSYPHTVLSLELHGRLFGTDQRASLQVAPWDDGAFAFRAEDLTQLHDGPATLDLWTRATGPEFSLPFSTLTQPQATSAIGMTVELELE